MNLSLYPIVGKKDFYFYFFKNFWKKRVFQKNASWKMGLNIFCFLESIMETPKKIPFSNSSFHVIATLIILKINYPQYSNFKAKKFIWAIVSFI